MSAIENFARQCVIYVNCQVKSSGRVETAAELAGLMRDLGEKIGELALESMTKGKK